MNKGQTIPELMRFFKADNFVQDLLPMSGAGDKNAKCISDMNNYNVSVLQGRWLIHYLIIIFS
jgi:hypothetical protein